MVGTGTLRSRPVDSGGLPEWGSSLSRHSLISVFVVAEVRLYREGLERFLGRKKSVEVIGSAGTRADAVAQICRVRPDVVLLGLGMRDGLETAREVRTALPEVKVIALGIQDDESDVIPWAEAGMAGYVSRDASLPDLLATIERASRGEMLLPPNMAAHLVARLSRMSAQMWPRPRARLTSREVDIVRLMGQGYSNKEIARALSIAVPTVKNHVHNILDKLQVRRRSDAVTLLDASSLHAPRV